jgi:hypothetical protein
VDWAQAAYFFPTGSRRVTLGMTTARVIRLAALFHAFVEYGKVAEQIKLL